MSNGHYSRVSQGSSSQSGSREDIDGAPCRISDLPGAIGLPKNARQTIRLEISVSILPLEDIRTCRLHRPRSKDMAGITVRFSGL